jgi:hypothetical protein
MVLRPPAVVGSTPSRIADSTASSRAVAIRPWIISWALTLSTVVPYLAWNGLVSTSAATSSSAIAAISESGGMRRVAASGVGTPRGERTVTSASPMPSDVSVFSTS